MTWRYACSLLQLLLLLWLSTRRGRRRRRRHARTVLLNESLHLGRYSALIQLLAMLLVLQQQPSLQHKHVHVHHCACTSLYMYIIMLPPVIFVSNSGKLDSQLKFVVHVHCVDILQHYVNCPCFYTPHCSVCVSEFNINFEYYMALYIISQMLLHCPIQLSKRRWHALDWKQVPLDTDSVASSWHDTLGRSVGCVLVWLWNPSSKACVLACPPSSLTSDLHRSTSLLRLWCRQSLLLQFHSDRRITTVQLYM